uniref:Tes106 n=1 Tax=Drosophila mulleri TaxID=7231 RepID=Q2VJU2_DROMU|nr:Tes106 [Drosophila mulleri]
MPRKQCGPKSEYMNPFYVGPYPDQSCGPCPFGIFSGFVPCGWPDRCKGNNDERQRCCVPKEADNTKSMK